MAKIENWMSDLYKLFGIEEPEVSEEHVKELEELRDRYELAAEVGKTMKLPQVIKIKLFGISKEDFENAYATYMKEHEELLKKVTSRYGSKVTEPGEVVTDETVPESGEPGEVVSSETTEPISDEADATGESGSGEPESGEPEVVSSETTEPISDEASSGEPENVSGEPEVVSSETTEPRSDEAASGEPEVVTGEVVNESEPKFPFGPELMHTLLNVFATKENFGSEEFIFRIRDIVGDSIDPKIMNEPYYRRKGWMYVKDVILALTGLDRETLNDKLKSMDKVMEGLCVEATRLIINRSFELFWQVNRLDTNLIFINPFDAEATDHQFYGFTVNPEALVCSGGSLDLTIPDKRWDAGQGFSEFYRFYKEDIDDIFNQAEQAMVKGVFNRKEFNPKGNYPIYYGSNYIRVIGGYEEGYEFWRDEVERKYHEFHKKATVNEAPQDTDADPVKSEHQQVEDEKPITVPAWSSPFEFDPKNKKDEPKKQ